jgi:hypothetical protein
MQLSLSVNNRNTVRGAVGSKGVLSAVISVSISGHGNEAKGKASIHALESPNVSEWSAGELVVGDKIEIRLLSDGEADPPTRMRSVSDIPGILFTDLDQARQALAKVSVCKEHLEAILRSAKDAEPHDEALKVQRAVVAIVQDLGKYIITPTLRSHPELLSEAKVLDLVD